MNTSVTSIRSDLTKWPITPIANLLNMPMLMFSPYFQVARKSLTNIRSKMRYKIILIGGFVFIAGVLAGCGSMSNASSRIEHHSTDAVLLFGVAPDTMVAILSGRVVKETFVPDKIGFVGNIRADSKGYILTQQPVLPEANQAYGLVQFQLGRGGPVFNNCVWHQALVVRPAGGEVSYLGELDVVRQGGSIKVVAKADMSRAENFLSENYSRLSGPVNYVPPRPLYNAPHPDCNKQVVPYVIPIYLKR